MSAAYHFCTEISFNGNVQVVLETSALKVKVCLCKTAQYPNYS